MFFLSCLLIFAFTNPVFGQNTCNRAGVVCSTDCNAVWFCTGVGATPIVTDNCQSRNLLCSVNETTASCVAPASSNCQPGGVGGELPIECLGGALIPDPYDCHRGYICSVSSPTPADQCECPSGTYWNIDNQCNTDTETLDGCCNLRDLNICPEGANDGYFGPSCFEQYYYVCALNSAGERVIHVLRCDGDQVWNPKTHICEDVIPPTSTESSTSTETETTDNSESTPTEASPSPSQSFDYDWVDQFYGISNRAAATCTPYVPPSNNSTTPPPPVNCNFPGQVIPDPNDTGCRRYYVCDESLTPILRECEVGTHLDCTNGCNCVFGPQCP